MSKGTRVTKEIDLSFNELMIVIRSLSRTQKLRLRKVLDRDTEPSRDGDEGLLPRVAAVFGEDLNKPVRPAHRVVVAQARRQRRDKNAQSADRMVEVQRETHRRLNPQRPKKG